MPVDHGVENAPRIVVAEIIGMPPKPIKVKRSLM
jgi:hypothetical protein